MHDPPYGIDRTEGGVILMYRNMTLGKNEKGRKMVSNPVALFSCHCVIYTNHYS
jgi:hypothetical protein